MKPELSGQWLATQYYPYGEITSFTIEAYMSFGEVVWSCTIPSLRQGCGGFTGPYEALSYALRLAEQMKGKSTTEAVASE